MFKFVLIAKSPEKSCSSSRSPCRVIKSLKILQASRTRKPAPFHLTKPLHGVSYWKPLKVIGLSIHSPWERTSIIASFNTVVSIATRVLKPRENLQSSNARPSYNHSVITIIPNIPLVRTVERDSIHQSRIMFTYQGTRSMLFGLNVCCVVYIWLLLDVSSNFIIGRGPFDNWLSPVSSPPLCLVLRYSTLTISLFKGVISVNIDTSVVHSAKVIWVSEGIFML